jgi:hypothetical protein
VDGLNLVAAKGGTTAAYDVTADISLFSQKMAEIRGVAIACEYAIPPPPAGEELDIGLVNVQYLPGAPGDAQLLPHADGLGDCGDAPGWYYDDPAKPTQILLCPASCTAAQSNSGAVIKVLFGCSTLVN